MPVCQSSRSFASMSRRSDHTFEAGGRMNSGMPTRRGSHSHAARNTTSTAMLAPTMPGLNSEALGAGSSCHCVAAGAATTAAERGSGRASGRGEWPVSTDVSMAPPPRDARSRLLDELVGVEVGDRRFLLHDAFLDVELLHRGEPLRIHRPEHLL